MDEEEVYDTHEMNDENGKNGIRHLSTIPSPFTACLLWDPNSMIQGGARWI